MGRLWTSVFDYIKFPIVEYSPESPETLKALRAFPVLKFSYQTILLVLIFRHSYFSLRQKSAVPRRVQISVEIGSRRILCFAPFSTIIGEGFICILKEQLERKMVTIFQGPANGGLLNDDNCLPAFCNHPSSPLSPSDDTWGTN